MEMDLSDSSLGSSEGEEDTKDGSSTTEKSESENARHHFPIRSEKNSNNKNDQCQGKYETEDSVAVARASTWKVQEGESPIGTRGKRLSCKISPVIGEENSKHSQSWLSTTSIDATFGSSSSNSMSSDEEPMYGLEEISEFREREDASDLERVFSGLPLADFENMSDSPSVTSSADHTGLINETQTSNCVFTGADGLSSLPEHSPSLKSSEISTNLHAEYLLSMATERSSNNSETDEMHFTKGFASDVSSQTEKLSSSITPTTESPMPRKPSSNKIRKDETQSAFSDCGSTGGFYDKDCDLQKDKSVRRKIKAKTPVQPSVSNASRRIGHTLLQISKTVEKTSNKGDDWDFYEPYSRKDAAKSSKTWMKDLLSFCSRTEHVQVTPRLDSESLLKEVHYFFRRNSVETDASLSWEERKRRIVTSPYFSDEFAQKHGLLSFEELMQKHQTDLEYCTNCYLKNVLRLQELCKTLIQYDVSEKALIDYCEERPHIPQSSENCSRSDRSDQGPSINDDVRRRLLWIAEEIGWDVVIDLYKKVVAKGASFLDILCDSEKCAASAAEELFRIRESPSPPQNSSQDPNRFLLTRQDTRCTDNGTLLRKNKSDDIDSSRSENNIMPKLDESIGEFSHIRLRESSNIISESDFDSHSVAGNESCEENIPLPTNKTSEKSVASDEENAGKDG